LIVVHGRAMISATRVIFRRQSKKAIIMPFSTQVISLRDIFGVCFFFFDAEFEYPDRLTIGKLKRTNY